MSHCLYMYRNQKQTPPQNELDECCKTSRKSTLNPTEFCISTPCSCVCYVVLEISRIDTASLTGGISLYTRASFLLWLCFASVYVFVCLGGRVCVCVSCNVIVHNPIRMMAAVINLIKGLLGFVVCQSDICPSCHLNWIATSDGGALLTCNLSNVGSCGYLEKDKFFITAKNEDTEMYHSDNWWNSACVVWKTSTLSRTVFQLFNAFVEKVHSYITTHQPYASTKSIFSRIMHENKLKM